MRFASSLLALGTTIALALAGAMPWTSGETARLVLPMLPVLSIVFWSLHRPAPMPATAVFAAGLMMDIVAQTPAGYWTLIALLTSFAARFARGAVAPEATAIPAAAAIVVLSISSWGLAYAYTATPPSASAQVVALLWSAGLYLPLAAMLAALAHAMFSQRGVRSVLGRGGS